MPTPEQALRQAAEEAMLPIRRTCEKIRELAAHTLGPIHAVEGLSLSRSSTLMKPVESSEAHGPTLPCVCLPLSKNGRFYGRSREVDTIDGFLTLLMTFVLLLYMVLAESGKHRQLWRMLMKRATITMSFSGFMPRLKLRLRLVLVNLLDV